MVGGVCVPVSVYDDPKVVPDVRCVSHMQAFRFVRESSMSWGVLTTVSGSTTITRLHSVLVQSPKISHVWFSPIWISLLIFHEALEKRCRL